MRNATNYLIAFLISAIIAVVAYGQLSKPAADAADQLRDHNNHLTQILEKLK